MGSCGMHGTERRIVGSCGLHGTECRIVLRKLEKVHKDLTVEKNLLFNGI